MAKRYKRGLVCGKFAPPHKGHIKMIQQALDVCEVVDVFVYSNPDMSAYPSMYREIDLEAELRKTYINPKARPTHSLRTWALDDEDVPHNNAPALEHRKYIKDRYMEYVLGKPDVIFGADDYIPGFAKYMGCEYVLTPRFEGMNATDIRREPYAFPQVEWLPETVRKYYDENYCERVAFVGAESTGKSTTAAVAASNLHSAYIPEVGAHVFEANNGKMDRVEQWNHTVNEQRRYEDMALANSIKYRYLMCDTEALTTKFFSYWFTGKTTEAIEDAVKDVKTRYKHWFLCDDGIPFDGTNMRGPEEIRKVHQGMLRMMLDDRGIDYRVLTGTTGERVAEVDRILAERRVNDWGLSWLRVP